MDTSMNERTADKKRINNAHSALIRQRVEALATLTKLEVSLEMLRQLIDVAPFAGMPTFENDALTCLDHLREATREIWEQISEMIHAINGESGYTTNRHVTLPTSSQKAKVVKVQSHLGTRDAWAEATSTRLAFFDFGLGTDRAEALRLFIPVKEDAEKMRVVEGLLSVAEFLESTLAKTEWP